MNFYEYYTKPEELDGYDNRHDFIVSSIMHNALTTKKKLTDKQEKIISYNPLASQLYAIHILKGPFPLGEPAIKRDKLYWKQYLEFIGE